MEKLVRENTRTKLWYRLIKVIYLLLYLAAIFYIFIVWVNETKGRFDDPHIFFIIIGIISLFFIFIQRCFYYIAFGKIWPKKETKE